MHFYVTPGDDENKLYIRKSRGNKKKLIQFEILPKTLNIFSLHTICTERTRVMYFQNIVSAINYFTTIGGPCIERFKKHLYFYFM